MVKRWRLKLICVCVLLLIAVLSNQINLTFNYNLLQNIKKSETLHYPDMYNHMFELTQVTLDDMMSSWDLDRFPLKVKLDCWVNESGGRSRLEDRVLKICICTSLLMKEFDSKRLSKVPLKLLVLKYILNELGSDNGNMLLISSNMEASVETEEFNKNITTVVSNLLLIKLTEMNGHQLEGKELMRGPYPTRSVRSLSLGNVMSSESEPLHHTPPPAPIFPRILTNSAQRDEAAYNNAGRNNNEQKSDEVQEQPSQMTQERNLTQSFESTDHTTRIKIQELQTSRSYFKKFKPKHRVNIHSVLTNNTKLKGFVIKGNKSLLARGFRTDYIFDSPELLQRRKHITAALEGASEQQRDKARISLNTNLLERGKHQQEKIQRYCKSENMSVSLPGNFMEIDTLFKHLLYDDSKKIVFCYVPKNSCSNMKRMMLILNGVIPANSSWVKRPPESVLGMVHSFRNLSREGAIYRLENYFKFTILRNPMERLLSAYRNKLEKPLDYTRVKKFPDRLKAFILILNKKSALKKWVALKNYSNDIHPSFSDTLDFMTKFTLSEYNEHFLPFMKLCHPCAINYDIFLNIKSLNYDIFALMEYMRIPFHYFPGIFKSSVTRDLLKEYYQQVPPKIKSQLFNILAEERDFYYDMYPEEL